MNDVKFSRNELYDLVWSESMLSLSKRFNISDVGLRKICKRMNIPTPPNGYWAKLQFGKRVDVQKLPEDYTGVQEVSLLIFKEGGKRPSERHKDVVDLQNLLMNDPKLRLEVPSTLSKPDKLIKAARERLTDKKNLPRWNNGLVKCLPDQLDIMVSPNNVGRALRFLDTLIKALRSMGYDIRGGFEHTNAIIEGEAIKIRLREKLNMTLKEVQEYSWKTYDYNPSGILYFKMGRWIEVAEWRDGKQALEEQLPRILAKLILTGKKIKEERIQDEIREKHEQEQKRIRKELEQRQEKELANFKNLQRKAKRWRQSMVLRNFLETLEDNANINNHLTEELGTWLTWAKRKADWYDPLIESEDELLKEVDRESLSFQRKKSSFW